MIFSTAIAETECTGILTSIKKLGFKREIRQLGRKPDILMDHGQGWEVCEPCRVLCMGSPELGVSEGSRDPSNTACLCQHASLKWGRFQTLAGDFRHGMAPKLP